MTITNHAIKCITNSIYKNARTNLLNELVSTVHVAKNVFISQFYFLLLFLFMLKCILVKYLHHTTILHILTYILDGLIQLNYLML